MQIAILGPLEVRGHDGAPIEVAGARLRTLLARLAVDAPRPVSVGALIDAVWGERPPTEASNALQTLVSRLRRAVGDTGAIVQSGAGYRLVADSIDAHHFATAAAAAIAAAARDEHLAVITNADEALAHWRGPALADLGDFGDALAMFAARLQDQRLAVVVTRGQAQLATGAEVDLAGLEALAVEHPLDERIAALLLRALGAAGRNADALRAYERLRHTLADELGTDPAADVQDIHLALLRGDIAPPRTAPSTARRTNLKAQLTTFVGRDDEVARIGKSLEQHRLVTLVGPGGAGKTRLAGEAAATVLDAMPDGVWLVELAPVSAGVDVAQAVLASLGLRDINMFERRSTLSARDVNTQLLQGLADRSLLLVLDNCEHLIDACAALADSLLAHCPGLRVLATSREPLGIVGEALLTVPPLGQPAPTASALEALDYPAVRLFADRAAAVSPQFAIDATTVAAVIQVVRRLDGLPLAIELAAARLRTMPIDDIAARLSDRFRLLTGGSRTALPRHRTLRAVVEWSWDLLPDAERQLAEQLAVFPAGATAASAAAIGDVGDLDVADLLASLVDKSLLQPTGDGRRLRMLETIREYGIERLAEQGELAEVRGRHAAHFGALVAEAEPHLTRGDQLPWFELIKVEHDNMLAAMRYRADLGDVDGALDIGLVLACHAMMMGGHADIPGWMDDVLRVPGGDPGRRVLGETLRALNLVAAGPGPAVGDGAQPDLADLVARMDDVDPTRSPFTALLRPATAFFAEDAEVAWRYIAETRAGVEPWGRAAALMLGAAMAENEGDVDAMRRDTETALGEFRELGERWGLASTLRTLGQIRTLDGDLDGAESALLEAMDVTRELGSRDDEGFVLGRLADLRLRQGDVDGARRYIDRTRDEATTGGAAIEAVFSLAMRSAVEQAAGNRAEARALEHEAAERVATMPVGHPAQGHIHAIVFGVSARVELEDGNLEAARERGAAAYEAAVATKDLPIVASIGVTLASIIAATGAPDEAAVLLGASARLRGADDLTALDIAGLITTLRASLGDEAFDARYAEGKALDRDAAIARLAVL